MKINRVGLGTLSAILCLSATSAYAQRGNKQNRPNRQNQQKNQEDRVPSGRIIRGALKEIGFAPSRVTISTKEGEVVVAEPTSSTLFHQGSGGTALMDFQRNEIGDTVVAEVIKAAGKWTLTELWDNQNWLALVARHSGIKSGSITSKTNKVLKLSGELRYALSKETIWVKDEKNATPGDFSARDLVYVKSEVQDNVPVAVVVANTAAGAESNALTRNNNELSGGIRPRPIDQKEPPHGGKRPTSAGPLYKIKATLKIYNSYDNATTGVAGAAGNLANNYYLNDNKVECFGEMRADNDLIWQWKREDASQHRYKSNEIIKILPPSGSTHRQGSTWIWRAPTVALKGFLKDDDNLTKDDTLCEWALTLDLEAAAGKGNKLYKTGSAWLYIEVTKG